MPRPAARPSIASSATSTSPPSSTARSSSARCAATSPTSPPRASRARLVDALGALADHADSTGGHIVVENILQYISNWLNTLDELGSFLLEIDRPNVTMHIDTHSMHMEERDPFAAVRRWGEWIGYVHFSDSNRAYPGGGCIDFKSHYHALFDIGYDDWITIESQAFPTGRECADRGLRYLKHIEEAARIERLAVLDRSSIRF
ncbi:sugar phosphate isomerase/epimerase [Actinomyces sp. B33]|uniref:sugar phosphate isomerase/epimerase family protein n=1 Tax=Actinomyces sp. B33 TaxID=2942131 RepID=UPI00234057FA|nr:sugar phosphate isomerase/epimerase family protein [Actinomyces sp. B33]MDC4232476.1 sugar phosphate isomerase/epimerase [Actinomyces sp. B33]